jgi:hypothetical protein
MGLGRKSKRAKEEFDSDPEEDPDNPYSLMTDAKSPSSCCCICYRYLLDTCMILALAPFVINCFIEASIILMKFEWENIAWGRSIIAVLAVSMWLGLAAFGILCCVAVMRRGVFTRRLRQKRKGQDQDKAEQIARSQSDISTEVREDSMA